MSTLAAIEITSNADHPMVVTFIRHHRATGFPTARGFLKPRPASLQRLERIFEHPPAHAEVAFEFYGLMRLAVTLICHLP